jgi:hypothetical protein
VIVVALILAWIIPVGGATLGQRFFDSLRVARPKATTAPTAPTNAGTLQGVVVGIVADSATAVREEPDQPSASLASAATLAGFRPLTLAARKDAPAVTVLGARSVGATVNRPLLATLMREAGRPEVILPATLDGRPFAVTNPRGIRLQYGNCPAPPAATIANQVNGPPPPSSDNGNCVVLVEEPRGGSVVPKDLDTAAVLAIALELSGMSPDQARDFQQLFGWSGSVALSPPRFVRSSEIVTIGSGRGVLLTTGGRRGPTYVLIWAKGDLVYTLTGYGSSADAIPLAASLS